MIMYRLTAFFLLFAPCMMSVANNTTSSDNCLSQLANVKACYLKAGKPFNATNSTNDSACLACNVKASSNLTLNSSCADVDKAVCSTYASCKDNCTAPGSCSDEVEAYYLCVLSSAAGSGKCQVQCNATSGNSNHTSAAGPDRFLGVAAIAIPMMLAGLVI